MGNGTTRKMRPSSLLPKIEWSRRNSVSSRLILGIIGFSSFIAIFTTAIQVYLDYKRDVNKIHGDLAYVQSVNLPPIAKSMWELSEQSIMLQLNSLVNHPGIDHVTVQVDGEVAWAAGAMPKGDVIVAEYSLVYSQGSAEQMLGRIHIIAGLTEIYRQVLQNAAVILVTNFLKTLVVAVFMFVLVHFLITRHLAALATYAKTMNLEGLATPFRFQRKTGETDSPDEFDDIARAMNKMRESLKSSYDELTISNERFQDLYDNAPDMFCSVDAQTTKIIQCNDTLAAKLGMSKDKIIGRPVFDLYHPDSHETAKNAFQEFVEMGRVNRDEMQLVTMNGDRIDVELRVTAIRNEDGDVVQSRSVWRDITRRKHAEEDRRLALINAEEANQAKSEFLASMSHELRTPLNAILGFADLMSHEVLGPLGVKKYGEYANDIHASGEHLLSLVNDLLDLSTIEAGKQNLNLEKVKIGEIIEECTKTLVVKAEENGIELVQSIPDDAMMVLADRRAVKQILINLLTNAVKFTSSGGKVEVSVKESNGEVAFQIADTGRGIRQEDLPTITDLFTKSQTDPYKVADGWGLGLAITKALVDLHDGKLDIQSELGAGTTITVTLPGIEST